MNNFASAMTLDRLVALHDEMAALVRAGVPLDKGLQALGGDMPGGLGRAARVLAKRLEAGQTLPDALAVESKTYPPVYRAVVEAGIRAGRLPAALESLAHTIRQARDLRRLAAASLVYPIVLCLTGWAFFLFFVLRIAPSWSEFFAEFHVHDLGLMRALSTAGDLAPWWGTLVPAGAIVLVVAWWITSSRATLVEPRGASALLGWMPWVGRMFGTARRATFVDVLALLVEHDVPLEESLAMAAAAAGDRRTLQAASALAQRLRQGQPLEASAVREAGLPPLVAWSIVAGRRHGELAASLRQAARTYHRRAQHAAQAARTFLPVLLTGAVGGLIVLLYGLVLFFPYATMLRALGAP